MRDRSRDVSAPGWAMLRSGNGLLRNRPGPVGDGRPHSPDSRHSSSRADDVPPGRRSPVVAAAMIDPDGGCGRQPGAPTVAATPEPHAESTIIDVERPRTRRHHISGA